VDHGGPGSNPGLVMWDFVMDKSGARAGFLRELLFPLHNLHSIYFSTIIFTITRGWHNRPGVAAVPTASQTRIKKVTELVFFLLNFSIFLIFGPKYGIILVYIEE
jgi:hypothetical protein